MIYKLGLFLLTLEFLPGLYGATDEHVHYPEVGASYVVDPAYVRQPNSDNYFKLHTTPKTWDQARKICLNEGGQLAVIESKEEEDLLVYMKDHSGNKDYFTFLGFHDLFAEGDFVTIYGQPLSSLEYVHWLAGEPNGGTNENCGSMHFSGGLNDIRCWYSLPFFCEIKPSQCK